MQTIIRVIEEEDIDFLIECRKQFCKETEIAYKDETIEKVDGKYDQCLFQIIMHGEQRVGYVKVYMVHDFPLEKIRIWEIDGLLIDEIFIASEHRRRGYAEDAIKIIMKDAHELAIPVGLYVSDKPEKQYLRDIYKKKGFIHERATGWSHFLSTREIDEDHIAIKMLTLPSQGQEQH